MKLTELEKILIAKVSELNEEVKDNEFWYEAWNKLNLEMGLLKAEHPEIFIEETSDENI